MCSRGKQPRPPAKAPNSQLSLSLIHIYQGTDGIRSVEIAQRLDVSKASVNKAIASLKSQGMVEQAHYGKVRDVYKRQAALEEH